MKRSRLLIALLALSLAPLLATAAPYAVGDRIDAFTTNDQHEKPYTLEADLQTLVVSFSMGDGKAANGWLEARGAGFLEARHAVFIANIHGMPGIGRMFALPKMRKYPHRILLADDDALLSRFPSQEKKLTVVRLDGAGVVTSIDFVAPKDGLTSIFE